MRGFDKFKSASDKNFTLLLRGSSVNLMAKILSVLFGFYASYMIANYYGADLVGVVATINSAVVMMSILALLGNQTLVLKLVPEFIEKASCSVAYDVFKRIQWITLISTSIVLLCWLLVEASYAGSLLPGLEKYLLLVVGLVFINGYKTLNTNVLRALGDFKIYSLYEFLPAFLLAVMVTLAIWIGIVENVFSYVYFLPILIVGLISFFLVNNMFSDKIKTDCRTRSMSIEVPSRRFIVRSSLPMLGVTLSNGLIANTDVLMLNYFETLEVVGVYSVYVKITLVTAIATQAINSMFAPTVAKLYASGTAEDMQKFAKKTTVLSFSISLLLVGVFVVLHVPLLSFYGGEFLTELPTLYILLASSVCGSFFGSVGFFLNMTGGQTSFLKIMIFAAALNIVLNAVLIPSYGPLGAAMATLGSVLSWNVLATIKIFRKHGYSLIWSNGIYG